MGLIDIVKVHVFVHLFCGVIGLVRLIYWLARWLYTWELAVTIAPADDVFGGDKFCHQSWLVDRKLVQAPPVFFIAGRPKAAFLFWFFGDFRCSALLFMVIHVIYKYKNR